LEDDFTTAAILVVDELLGVVALLLSTLAEELFKARQGLVDMTCPCGEREIDLRSLELLADL
jgi:hypothetical protein